MLMKYLSVVERCQKNFDATKFVQEPPHTTLAGGAAQYIICFIVTEVDPCRETRTLVKTKKNNLKN